MLKLFQSNVSHSYSVLKLSRKQFKSIFTELRKETCSGCIWTPKLSLTSFVLYAFLPSTWHNVVWLIFGFCLHWFLIQGVHSEVSCYSIYCLGHLCFLNVRENPSQKCLTEKCYLAFFSQFGHWLAKWAWIYSSGTLELGFGQ